MVSQMTRFETSSEIDAMAALWAARLDRGPLTELDQASLDCWLEGDVRRLGALARAQAMLAAISLSASTGETAFLGSVEEPEAPPGTPEASPETSKVVSILPHLVSRRRLIQAGTATALAASFGALALLPIGTSSYTTARGEVRLLPLADGSVVTMNTDSHIRVNFSKANRTIYLDKGEVLFDVAKSPQRPFLVKAGMAKVQAVGTAFSVRRTGVTPVEVMVREGLVKVAAPQGHKQSMMVGANMKAVADASGDITAKRMSNEEMERMLAWREGKIAFSETSLRDAAHEFNRYNKVKIEVGNGAIANRTVTGMFSANDPQGFAHAAALTLDLKVQEKSGQIIFSTK